MRYVFLFWIWWPSRSRAIAALPDPYDTLAWEFFRTRVQVLNWRKYGALACEHCKSQRSGWYEVHHIHRRADRPELFLWLPNLMLLCRGCHMRVHGGILKNIDELERKRAGRELDPTDDAFIIVWLTERIT